MRTPDVIPVIESVYAVEQPRAAWLSGVLASVSRHMPGLVGAGGLLYKITDDALDIQASAAHDGDPQWLAIGRAAHDDAQTRRAFLATYRNVMFEDMVARGRAMPNRDALRDAYRGSRLGSCFLVNGFDPAAGYGCAVYLFGRDDAGTARGRAAAYCRIASHLATGYRLQRRLEDTAPRIEPGAVLDARGRAVAPAADAQSGRAIAAAFEAREAARGRGRKEDPLQALSLWRAMVSGRWTLVDRLERDGRRYVVAEENSLALRGVDALAPRERAVLALAAAGRVNKIIAYELGIAPATVRVLMARASAKLGVRSRAALVEKYRAHAKSDD